MYLAAIERGAWATTPDVARAFGISTHHLQKAVQGLVRGGHVEALQGRGGGVRLAKDPASMRLGAIVAELEGSGCLVDCRRGPCPLAGRCLLKSALDVAEHSFIRELDRFTLADVVANQTKSALNKLVAVAAAGR
jgi:Rrf2 family nitric oxide-sensitive transcriptional repressor